MKKYKGDYGYIEYQKKLGIIRTAAFLVVVLGFLLLVSLYSVHRKMFLVL